MARAKQPVNVAGIEFDALIDEQRQHDAEIPQFTTEEGFQISDAIIIDAETLKPDFEAWTNTSAPTCRSLDRAYEGADQDHFWFYMIDGFIVSDNVQVNMVETLDQQFRCSDHNPVRMTFTLK